MRRRARVALSAVVWALAGTPAPAKEGARAELIGSYVWQGGAAEFGGFSGFDLQPDGAAFVAVTDRGSIVSGKLARGASGGVTAVTAGALQPLLGGGGQPLEPEARDAEGLSIAPDGSVLVSTERTHLILRYADAAGPSRTVSEGLDLSGLSHNRGLEALAVAEDGVTYAIPERAATWGGPTPVHVLRDGAWTTPLSVRVTGNWRIVGADFGPDGKLYLLERDYWGLVGFMTRLRRLTLDGDVVAADETLAETQAGEHENLEGIAVWRDGKGDIRLTMISDDNFLPLSRTEIVDYRVSEPLD